MSIAFESAKKYAAPSILIYTIAIVIWFVFRQNPELFELKKEVLVFLNEAVNAILLLLIPFLFGVVAASARIMIADLRFEKNLKLIAASGLMAAFSWLGIKSKVFIALLTPYIVKNIENGDLRIAEGGSEFYSMALVAVLVGAFSSSLYIFIQKKVESLAGESSLRNK